MKKIGCGLKKLYLRHKHFGRFPAIARSHGVRDDEIMILAYILPAAGAMDLFCKTANTTVQPHSETEILRID
jgi:hypothetical protein